MASQESAGGASLKRACFAALIVAGLLVRAPHAGACTCLVRSLPEQLEAASAVFRGTVRNVRPATEGELSITFTVLAVYKGHVESRAGVRTARDAAGCGVPFTRDTEYVVFAAGELDALTTGTCNGTTDDVGVVAGLSPIRTFAPPPDGELPGDDPGSRSLPIGGAAGLLALVLSGSIWAWLVRARPPRPLV